MRVESAMKRKQPTAIRLRFTADRRHIRPAKQAGGAALACNGDGLCASVTLWLTSSCLRVFVSSCFRVFVVDPWALLLRASAVLMVKS